MDNTQPAIRCCNQSIDVLGRYLGSILRLTPFKCYAFKDERSECSSALTITFFFRLCVRSAIRLVPVSLQSLSCGYTYVSLSPHAQLLTSSYIGMRQYKINWMNICCFQLSSFLSFRLPAAITAALTIIFSHRVRDIQYVPHKQLTLFSLIVNIISYRPRWKKKKKLWYSRRAYIGMMQFIPE